MKVSQNTNWTTLSIADKLKFKIKTFEKENHEYINSRTFPVHEIIYKAWTNVFPGWYKVADMTRIDDTGSYAYYTTNNSFIQGGWAGADIISTMSGTYATGEGTYERYMKQSHSATYQVVYDWHTENVLKYGFLYKFRFTYPSTTLLNEFTAHGFTVINNTTFITVYNTTTRITWRLNEKVIITETITNSITSNTTKTYYKYFEEFNEYLMVKEVDVTPSVFENGDCYDYITETTYDNYNTQCEKNIENRSIEVPKDALKANFEVVPNPAQDYITVTLPKYNHEASLTIVNTHGELVKVIVVTANETMVRMDISDLPKGLYVVKLKQDARISISKFIKI